MEFENFIENFKDQFDDELTSELTPETVFRELEGWSSIVALSVMSMIDEEYDVQLTADDIRNSHTLGDLFNIVSSKQ